MARGRRAPDEGMLSFDERRGLWHARLPRSVDPRRRSVYAKTQAEALKKLRQARSDAEKGLRPTLTGMSRLGDYLDEWLKLVAARVQAGSLAASTAVGYEKLVRLYLKPHLGRISIRRLPPGHVEQMFGAMLADSLSPATCKNARTALSKALSDAMRDSLVERNVARLVLPPKDKPDGRVRRADPALSAGGRAPAPAEARAERGASEVPDRLAARAGGHARLHHQPRKARPSRAGVEPLEGDPRRSQGARQDEGRPTSRHARAAPDVRHAPS